MRERYEQAEAAERQAYRSAITLLIIAGLVAMALVSVPFDDISIGARVTLVAIYPVVLAVMALMATICLIIASTFVIEPPGPFDLTMLRAAAALATADAVRCLVLLAAAPMLGWLAGLVIFLLLLHRLFELEGVEVLTVGLATFLVCATVGWGAVTAVASIM